MWREMKKTLKERKKHVGTKVGKKLIAMAVLHAPKLGLEAASTMMPLFVASFLADLGLGDCIESISNLTPCAKTMKDYVFDSVVDSILLERNKMKNLPLTILADKGDGRKEREGANFVKLVAKYCHETNEVNVTCIGIIH